MELANVIKQHRELNNWSQDDLADILNVSRQSVSKWESNKNYPSLDILIVMSDLFEITLDQLVKGDEHFKKSILKGEYPTANYYDRPKTIVDFLYDSWWLLFPIGAFIVWVVNSILGWP